MWESPSFLMSMYYCCSLIYYFIISTYLGMCIVFLDVVFPVMYFPFVATGWIATISYHEYSQSINESTTQAYGTTPSKSSKQQCFPLYRIRSCKGEQIRIARLILQTTNNTPLFYCNNSTFINTYESACKDTYTNVHCQIVCISRRLSGKTILVSIVKRGLLISTGTYFAEFRWKAVGLQHVIKM